MEKGAFFLIRSKEMEAKKLAGALTGEFDTTVDVALVRGRLPAVHSDPLTRFIWKGASFDFLEYGADASYSMSLRAVCARLSSTAKNRILSSGKYGQGCHFGGQALACLFAIRIFNYITFLKK